MIRICSAYFQTWYAFMLAYRGELLLWIVASSLPLIMMGVWTEAGESGHFPMGAIDFARYFLAAFLVRQLTVCWVIYEFEHQVVSGQLSALLLHPVDPNWRFILMHAAEQAARAPLLIVALGLCVLLFPTAFFGDGESVGAWLPHPVHALAAAVTIYLAFLTRYFLQYTIAMLAFWIERASAIEHALYLPYLLLSGMLFPFQVLAASESAAVRLVGQIAMWTPFPYMLWMPATLLSTTTDSADWLLIGRGLAVLGAWATGFFLLSRVVWWRGLRHYSAMGA